VISLVGRATYKQDAGRFDTVIAHQN